MKKKLMISAMAVMVVLCAALIYAINFFNNASDYKEALAVVREQTAYTAVPPAGEAVKSSEQKDEQKDVKKDDEEFAESSTINILFAGIDRDEDRDKTLGIYRTDSISVVNVNLDTKKVTVFCIPRDTYAFVPVEGKEDKINHAYAFGSIKGDGIKSTVDTVNKFIKYSAVDYYFAIDMEPIPEIVDTLGGIELDVETDMGKDIIKGRQLLNGSQALTYVRWRYSGDGDIDRIKRQQKFLMAMYDKLMKKDQILNAIKLVLSYNKSVKTNMSAKQLAALAILAGDIPQDMIRTEIVPGSAKTINKIWYWVPDQEKTDILLKEIFSE